MDKKKLYKILEFNKTHSKEISIAKNTFYDCIGRQNPTVISDMQTLAQLIFDNRGYKFLRIPMKSKEIGAFQLRLNNANYLVLNTSKSLANNNFAIAHELYHVLIQNNSTSGNIGELYLNNYDEIEEEQMANAFAGAIIMPTEDVRLVVGLLTNTKELSNEIKQKYPNMQKQLKTINVFTIVQYMISEEIITSKEESLNALKKIMGDKVKLIIREDLPFSSIEKTITIEEAVEKIFNNEQVELAGREA